MTSPMRGKKTVLLALTDAHHGYFQGVARYAREHRWHLVTDMIYTARIPYGWRGDGIISFIGYRNDLADFIRTAGTPTVEISLVRQDIPLPRVEGDNEMIGRLAADHFLERGFRHFAWAPLLDDLINAERHRGYSLRLAEAGWPCHRLPEAVSLRDTGGTLDWAGRRKRLMEELRGLPKPLAVFGYNDCVAAEIIDSCEDAGVLVPESVAVLGVDNDAILCECLRVPLSSVCHDLEGMAYGAAALLDRIMDGLPPPAEPVRFPPKGLVVRRSSDIMAIGNQAVARALRAIEDRYTDPTLGVNDIAKASGTPRRTLEKLFRLELRRTVNEEIVRVRIAKARDLLQTTTMKIHEIAAAAGFCRPNHFYRVFRQHLSLTPNAYRAAQHGRRPSAAAGFRSASSPSTAITPRRSVHPVRKNAGDPFHGGSR